MPIVIVSLAKTEMDGIQQISQARNVKTILRIVDNRALGTALESLLLKVGTLRHELESLSDPDPKKAHSCISM